MNCLDVRAHLYPYPPNTSPFYCADYDVGSDLRVLLRHSFCSGIPPSLQAGGRRLLEAVSVVACFGNAMNWGADAALGRRYGLLQAVPQRSNGEVYSELYQGNMPEVRQRSRTDSEHAAPEDPEEFSTPGSHGGCVSLGP